MYAARGGEYSVSRLDAHARSNKFVSITNANLYTSTMIRLPFVFSSILLPHLQTTLYIVLRCFPPLVVHSSSPSHHHHHLHHHQQHHAIRQHDLSLSFARNEVEPTIVRTQRFDMYLIRRGYLWMGVVSFHRPLMDTKLKETILDLSYVRTYVGIYVHTFM